MARGRGRGRGARFRPRPPSSLRNSMQELGLNATTNYVNSLSDVLGVSVDAARAYFPPLPESSVAQARPPTEAERAMLARMNDIEGALRESPARAQKPMIPPKDPLSINLQRLESFFLSDPTAKAELNARKSLAVLCDSQDPWIVPEILPVDLRPKKKLRTDSISNGIDKTNSESGVGSTKDDTVRNLLDDEPTDQQQNQDVDDEQNPDEPKKDVPDDDDLEEILEHDEEAAELEAADYTAGVRCDDDDGYESVDSGRDLAVL